MRPRAAAAMAELKLRTDAAPVNWRGAVVVAFFGAWICPSPIWVITGGLGAAEKRYISFVASLMDPVYVNGYM